MMKTERESFIKIKKQTTQQQTTKPNQTTLSKSNQNRTNKQRATFAASNITNPTITTNNKDKKSTKASNNKTMKFSTSTTTLFFTAAAASVLNNNNGGVEALLSPFVTCCEEQGGEYEILNTSNGGQSGFCRYNEQNYAELTFYEVYCARITPPPTPSPTPEPTPVPTLGPTPGPTPAPNRWIRSGFKYALYAVNDGCGMPSGNSVTAKFTLEKVGKSFAVEHNVEVNVDDGQCVYVGGTNLDELDYIITNGFFSNGNASCKDIGSTNDGDCNLIGMDENACVINIC